MSCQHLPAQNQQKRNARTRCEIYSKVKILSYKCHPNNVICRDRLKIEWWCWSGDISSLINDNGICLCSSLFIFNFKCISPVFPMFLLLILYMWLSMTSCVNIFLLGKRQSALQWDIWTYFTACPILFTSIFCKIWTGKCWLHMISLCYVYVCIIC